jgi:hypothetical protein
MSTYVIARPHGDTLFIHTPTWGQGGNNVATTRKPKSSRAKVEVEVDEDEELEELEDELDELEALADEDEDEPDTDDDEDEDDEEEAPKKRAKKTSKTTTKEAPAKKKRESTIYGTAELAADLDTDGKNLRVMLRDIEANHVKSKKFPHGSFNDAGRYEWEDLDDALEVLGFDDAEEAIDRLKEARNTRLDALKERNADKKKTTAKKTKKVAEPEDEDEDVDLEDEDEDEEPVVKKPARRRSSK